MQVNGDKPLNWSWLLSATVIGVIYLLQLE